MEKVKGDNLHIHTCTHGTYTGFGFLDIKKMDKTMLPSIVMMGTDHTGLAAISMAYSIDFNVWYIENKLNMKL